MPEFKVGDRVRFVEPNADGTHMAGRIVDPGMALGKGWYEVLPTHNDAKPHLSGIVAPGPLPQLAHALDIEHID